MFQHFRNLETKRFGPSVGPLVGRGADYRVGLFLGNMMIFSLISQGFKLKLSTSEHENDFLKFMAEKGTRILEIFEKKKEIFLLKNF